MLMWFMLGVMCLDWKDALRVLLVYDMPLLAKAAICAGFAGCSVIFVSGGDSFKFLMPWLRFGTVMVVSTLFCKFAEYKWMQPLIIVCDSSYIVYLFHTTFMGFAKSFEHKNPMMNGESDLMFSIGAVIVVCAGVICPVLLHRYVLNRWNLTKVLFGLK